MGFIVTRTACAWVAISTRSLGLPSWRQAPRPSVHALRPPWPQSVISTPMPTNVMTSMLPSARQLRGTTSICCQDTLCICPCIGGTRSPPQHCAVCHCHCASVLYCIFYCAWWEDRADDGDDDHRGLEEEEDSHDEDNERAAQDADATGQPLKASQHFSHGALPGPDDMSDIIIPPDDYHMFYPAFSEAFDIAQSAWADNSMRANPMPARTALEKGCAHQLCGACLHAHGQVCARLLGEQGRSSLLPHLGQAHRRGQQGQHLAAQW
jgi:hypothetical protein